MALEAFIRKFFSSKKLLLLMFAKSRIRDFKEDYFLSRRKGIFLLERLMRVYSKVCNTKSNKSVTRSDK